MARGENLSPSFHFEDHDFTPTRIRAPPISWAAPHRSICEGTSPGLSDELGWRAFNLGK